MIACPHCGTIMDREVLGWAPQDTLSKRGGDPSIAGAWTYTFSRGDHSRTHVYHAPKFWKRDLHVRAIKILLYCMICTRPYHPAMVGYRCASEDLHWVLRPQKADWLITKGKIR